MRTAMVRLLSILLLPLALHGQAADPGFAGFAMKLPAPMREQLEGRFWRPGCPVALSDLRLLTVRHYGWDGDVTTGQVVVNTSVARPLISVFSRLYELKFPIRHLRFADLYGPGPTPPDTSGSFHCRPPAPSPCPGSKPGSSWSMHAYGLAVDLNPWENPYVGCGISYHPDAKRYIDRTPLRKGMVTPAVVRAFRSVGWGWGGDWTGVKDWMHFSATGH
jgi:D-alanyl-D-alanine carboxypeptidase